MNKCFLKDITNKIGSGATPSGGSKAYKGGSYALIRSQNVLDMSFSQEGLAYIDDEQARKLENVKVESGDILFNITGDSICRCCVVPDYILPARVNQHVAIIRPKAINSLYLMYYLQYLKPYLMNICGNGSSRNALTKDNLEKIEIEISQFSNSIANVLSLLDKKIANNNRTSQELEALAKTLYDYWFLQFEFPNEEGKPYKSSGGKMVWNDKLKREIPEGWEVRKYCEISTTVTGKEDANFATVNGEYAYFTCGFDILKCDEFKFDGKAILIAGNGDFNVKYYNGKFNAYQRTYVLMPDEKYIGILYQASLRKINQFKSSSNGSIVKFITKGDVDGIELIIPNKEGMLEPFNIILDTIQNNNRQSRELASLRDFLLPMLMNGQVTFKDENI